MKSVLEKIDLAEQPHVILHEAVAGQAKIIGGAEAGELLKIADQV